MKMPLILLSLCTALSLTACNGGSSDTNNTNGNEISPANASSSTTTRNTANLSAKERLGQKLFYDTRFSSPPGLACASCHDPANGFTDPDKQFPTSAGAVSGRFDERHTPSNAYATFSPDFHYDATLNSYVGGLFWDGRATNLAAQALGLFLEPTEMANPDPVTVVNKLKVTDYTDLVREVYGQDILDDVARAYTSMGDAIATYEKTAFFHPFDSKYDAYLAGKTTLNEQEAEGLKLFNDPAKGNCATCHTSSPTANGTPPLFTNFAYANIGLPVNPAIDLPIDLDASDFKDYGLGGRLEMTSNERGKFKVPTLRNIAKTSPYGHNGIFADLREMVAFHNARDTETGRWDVPEVNSNLDNRVGKLGLTDAEIDAIVAFLATLTDGYTAIANHKR